MTIDHKILKMDNLSEPVKLPPKKRIKRCNFKGCGLTENDTKIVNHSCPEHHAIMKERHTKQRINNFAKHKALLQNKFDFVSCCSLAKNADFVKYDSYTKDVLMKAAIEKGKLVGLTSAEKSPYLSLKKHGMAYIENGIEIDNEAYNNYVGIVDSNKNKFEKLFPNLTKDNNPRFIPDKEANRYVALGEDCNLEEWNNIQEQLEYLVLDLKLPAKGTTASKFVPDIKFQYTILKSDAGLSKVQHAHTDKLLPFSLRSSTKFF